MTVARGVDEAFKLFTEGLSGWWPFDLGHCIDKDRVTGAVFEPKEGGRVYEVWDDGSEHHWADVLAYEEPSRLVIAWKPNPERPAPTEVEVRFIAEGAGTRLELEHRGWERLGAKEGAEARQSYDSGWPATLERYSAAAA